MKVLLFVLLVVAALGIGTSESVCADIQPAIDPIQSDVVSGELSPESALLDRAMRILQPESLPPQYRSGDNTISKCATDDLTEAFAVVLDKPEQYSDFAKVFMARPVTQWYVESPLGYFRLHFDTSGPNSVPTTDADTNGLPDYIDRACDFADSSWLYEVVTLGHYPPVPDFQQGGSDQYDIYFQQIPYYGYTSPETAGPAPWNDFSSHIVVHPTFVGGFPPNNDPEGDAIGALKVTIAHEFYHAVQFAYDVTEMSFFMEQSSTWMEEMAYPQVDDNYNYLPYFYNNTEAGLQDGDIHPYASFIWPKFLQERFGPGILRALWSNCRTTTAVTAWGMTIDSAGSTIESEFARFALWNYYTGNRNIFGRFLSGADYPQVNIMRHHNTLPDSGNTSTLPPEPFASNYIVVENLNGYDGMLTFDFTGLTATVWGVSYIVDFGDGVYFDSVIAPLSNGKVKISIPHFENALRVVFIPAVCSHFGTNFNYTYHLYFRTPGDVDLDGRLSISDAVYLINWIFAGGTPPNPIPAADLNCSGQASVSDVVYLIRYIFAGGPAPCEL